MRTLIRVVFGTSALVDLAILMTGFTSGCVVDISDLHVDADGSEQAEARGYFTRTLSVGTQTALRLDGANGSIEVRGIIGGSEIQVQAIRKVRSHSRRDAEAHLSLLQVSVSADAEAFHVATSQPDVAGDQTYQVDYDISLPRHLSVVVTNGNGDVTLRDMAGSVRVSLANGRVESGIALPLGGEIVQAVGNGSLELSIQPDVSAALHARIGNGFITVKELNLGILASSPHLLEGILGAGIGTIDLAVGNGWIEVKGG